LQASILASVAPKILSLMRSALDQYAALRESGEEITPDLLTLFLVVKLGDWSPSYKGHDVLDDEGRHALASFLGRLAFSLGSIHHNGDAP
jgi:hypothetical protein